MKKSMAVVLIVLLMSLLVVGIAFGERRTCDKCGGTGVVCGTCGQSLNFIGASHAANESCKGRGMTCYICDGNRYVEVDVCN